MEHAVPLTPEAERALTFQAYPPPPAVEDVGLAPLKKLRGENGWFMEHLRLDDGWVQCPSGRLEVRQVSVSYAAPRRLNAFHVHPQHAQSEAWCVIQGLLCVWLIDCRQASATAGVRRRIVLSGEEPALLSIPAGVAHGYRAGPAGAILLYAADRQFDTADPDEGRLPWDHFGPELWDEDRG